MTRKEIKCGKWEYMGEGGKHAVFIHSSQEKCSQPDVCQEYHGRVLRINKAAFHGKKIKVENDQTILYRKKMKDVFKNYMDEPQKYTMHSSLAQTLREQAVNSELIPKSRIKDWVPEMESAPLSEDIFVDLIPNYRTQEEHQISIEIKPKAGYLPSSPLIHPNRRFKYHTSRFQILQKLNIMGKIEKGWNCNASLEERIKSDYDPLDLFSEDSSRIRKAIDALFACPQNNLKVYWSNTMLFGHECNLEEKKFSRCDAYNSLFCVMDQKETSNGSGTIQLEHELKEIISNILRGNTFLTLLLHAQKMYDLLDVDGAILVYNRLLSLCGNSHEKVESAFDDMNHSPAHHCHTLEVFVQYLKESSYAKESCGQGMEIIESLSKEDCTSLLSDWLFSLALCDVSFFIVLRTSNSNEDSIPGSKTIESSSGIKFEYDIKVVDYDRKLPSKLRKREQEERNLDTFGDYS